MATMLVTSVTAVSTSAVEEETGTVSTYVNEETGIKLECDTMTLSEEIVGIDSGLGYYYEDSTEVPTQAPTQTSTQAPATATQNNGTVNTSDSRNVAMLLAVLGTASIFVFRKRLAK